MSASFKRLSQGFANLDPIQGRAAPSDTRSLKQWLENLPRANPKETANLLKSALVASAAIKLDGATRYNQLELMRAAVIDTITWLERQYLGSPLPLTHDRLAYALLAQQLDLALADGYRLSCYELCSPNGSIPMLKSAAVAGALARSAWHYQQVLIQSWKLYRHCADGVWLGLHRVYRFALSINLHNKDCDDAIQGSTVRVHDIYIETALLSLMNPYAFAQSEQDQLKSLAAGFATRCTIQNRQPEAHFAKVPLDADLPIDSNLPEQELAYLEYSALYQALEKAEPEIASELLDIEISKSVRQSVPVSLRKRALRALGLASARDCPRIYSEYSVQTIVGLSAIHFFCAGQIDFESFIQKLSQLGSQGLSMAADWLNMSTEVSAQKTLQALVLDHSIAGYRLHWPEDQILRARVGEIIGINLAGIGNQPDWMVAVIRWLRYERDGSMTAGLKLLTRRCHAVALRVNKDGQPGQLLRGLELEALAADLPRRFLMSDRLQGRSHMLDVMFGFEPNRIGPVRTQQTLKTTPHSLASNMDYTLLNEQN